MLSNVNSRLSVGQKITVLLLVMLTIAVISVGTVYYSQSETEKLDNSVDVAGEQRMLTQRMARYANIIAAGNANAQTYDRLTVAAQRYESNLVALRDGGDVDGTDLNEPPQETRDQLATQRAEWNEFYTHVKTLSETDPQNPDFTSSVAYVVAHDEALLNRSDAVVTAYASLENSSQYATEIDVAGRQRMRSQQLVKTVLFINQHSTPGENSTEVARAKADLRTYVQAYDTALTALRVGGEYRGRALQAAPPAVEDELDDARSVWAPYRSSAFTVTSTQKYEPGFVDSHQYVQTHADTLLETSDETVQSFTAASAAQIQFMQGLLFVLIVVNAGVFVGGSLLGRRYIGRPIADVATAIGSIADGSFNTALSDRTHSLSHGIDENTRDETTRLVAATEEMESYLTTVVTQAQALARQDFEAAVLDEDVPGEFGDALADVHAELKELIETFQSAVEHAGHSIYVTDATGTIEYVNPTFEETTGYTSADVIGKTPRILNSGVHGEEFYTELWETILGGEIWESEIVNERKTGEEYVVDQTIVPILDEHDEPQKFVATNQEITERKERERRLRELHRATRRLVTATDRGEVAALTAQAASTILGYDSSVVRYVTDDGLLRPVAITDQAQTEMGERPDYPISEDILPARAYTQGEPQLVEDLSDHERYEGAEIRSAMYLPIGDYGILSVTDSVPRAFGQSDINLVSVLVASTETALDRLERENEIRRQNERLEKFGRTVAHDLRNPINVVEANLDVATLSDDPQEAHGNIQKACAHMTDLVDDLLALAKQGKVVLDPSPAPLDQCANEAWNQVETASMELDVGDVPEILMDQNRVQQVFENLFRNAKEHAGPDATIRIGMLDDGFYVEDDGPGIPENVRDSVFDSGMTTDEDGTGFGLTIVKQIATAHNWTISATEGTDGGARFEFRGVEFV